MRSDVLLVVLFFMKLSIDFLSPVRAANFLLTSCAAIGVCFVLLAQPRTLARVGMAGILLALSYLIMCVWWYLLSDDLDSFLRYVSLVPIYYSVKLLVLNLSEEKIAAVCRIVLNCFIFFFCISFVVSVGVANPLRRQFFNFEHANILGSYALCSLAFVYAINSVSRARVRQKVIPVVMCMLSTSTGASILSLAAFLNMRKFGFISIIRLLLVGVIGVGVSGYVIYAMDIELFSKIFGPFQLIWNGAMDQVVELARLGRPIQELGDEYQSSLTWRFYAYVIFGDFIKSLPLQELLFGLGFGGYTRVWGGMMPHNDFLLVLVDFGLLALVALTLAIGIGLRLVWKRHRAWVPIVFVLVFRLSLENNISSFYLVSLIVMTVAFAVASLQIVTSHQRARALAARIIAEGSARRCGERKVGQPLGGRVRRSFGPA